MSSSEPTNNDKKKRRKLRVLVITMGSPRQDYITSLFAAPGMAADFEAPIFSPGIPARSLRTRFECLSWVHRAGLVPPQEFQAIQKAYAAQEEAEAQKDIHYDGRMFFDHLKHENVPVTPGRRGSPDDVKLHFSVEFWRKAKTINRGRSVLACTLAHLIAMQRLVDEDFDLILEDNVRAPIIEQKAEESISTLCPAAERIWETMDASQEWTKTDDYNDDDENDDDVANKESNYVHENKECHVRYYGWLGSQRNLEWILQTHIAKRAYQRRRRRQPQPNAASSNTTTVQQVSIFPFPLPEHLDEDHPPEEEEEDKKKNEKKNGNNVNKFEHKRPGGNPVWGCYAYWVSKKGHSTLMETLRNDVGAMLWKGKRARFYAVKPIDKILPRQTMSILGNDSVQLSTHPMFFRAPMLTSKIHTQWDPEFCKSTTYQLQNTNLDWSNIWLTPTEQQIVQHWRDTRNGGAEGGEWLTIKELELLNSNKGEKDDTTPTKLISELRIGD